MQHEFDLHYVRPDSPETRPPSEAFTQIAIDVGLIGQGEKVDQRLIDYAMAVVENCAKVADSYFDPRKDVYIGQHIRAVYGAR
jgi:hypothetical protein